MHNPIAFYLCQRKFKFFNNNISVAYEIDSTETIE